MITRIPAAERFWPKVDKNGPGGCWLWTGHRSNLGYGTFTVTADVGVYKNVMAHRFAYEQSVGPIPAGLQIDHLCRVRHCVNPAHLEAVTPRENTARGDTRWQQLGRRTECPRGHPFNEANTYTAPGRSGRECRPCRNIANRKRRQRNKEAVA